MNREPGDHPTTMDFTNHGRRLGSRLTPRRGPRLLAFALLLGAALAVLALVDRREPPPQAADPDRPFTVGAGARSAQVLPARGPHRRATVIFLHGWGLIGADAYRAWLRHLAARGSDVIVPRYQIGLRTPTPQVPDNALAGVRSGLRRLRPRPQHVVVIGHSAGGVLAVGYAARAAETGLPPARALMVVYPGGAVRNMPRVPQVDPGRLPETVRRLVVMASPADQVVGTAPAEAIVAGATNVDPERRRLTLIEDAIAADHYAPALAREASRQAFWKPLDELIASVD